MPDILTIDGLVARLKMRIYMIKSKRFLSALILILFILVSCAPNPVMVEEQKPAPNNYSGNLFDNEPEVTNTVEEELHWKLIGQYGDTDIYKIRGYNVLIGGPSRYTTKEQEIIEGKIEQYKTIIQAHKDINFHAFYLELIENSPYHPVNSELKNPDAGRSFDFFAANKPKRLKLDALRMNSFADHLKYYYRTDHHWNVYGVLQGYKQIYQLLAESYPEISPMITTGEIYTFPDIAFLGRWADLLDYNIKKEPFSVYLANLPPYRIYDREGNEIDYNSKDEYLAGQYPKDKYADHYGNYYGSDVDFLDYVSENGSDRNLLIIGDSFTNAIEPLLASHYHHTYCVDIRKYPDYQWSFSEFVSQYDVDDVLILGGASVVLYQWRWSIQP